MEFDYNMRLPINIYDHDKEEIKKELIMGCLRQTDFNDCIIEIKFHEEIEKRVDGFVNVKCVMRFI
jgi:hypothetical protein